MGGTKGPLCLGMMSIWTGTFYVLSGYPGEHNEDLVGNLPMGSSRGNLPVNSYCSDRKENNWSTETPRLSSSDPSVLKLAGRMISGALSGP